MHRPEAQYRTAVEPELWEIRVKAWRWIEQSVRHKLVAIALLPLVLMLPLMLAAVWWWSDVAYDKLLISKVRSDLAVADGYFEQLKERVEARVRLAAASHSLLRATARNTSSDQALEGFLEQQRKQLELDFLLVDPEEPAAAGQPSHGARLAKWTSSDVHRAMRHASPDWAALGRAEGLQEVNPQLPDVLVMVATSEVRDMGQVVASVTGGVLLNRNDALIDRIENAVYPRGALPTGGKGAVTLFRDDVRISTNLRTADEMRAVGTRASAEVSQAVLGEGRTWLHRAQVLDDWYISGYKPLIDASGTRVGMLYVGYLEQPYRFIKLSMLAAISAIFILGAIGTVILSLRAARTIFRPVERIDLTIQRVEAGDIAARVGTVASSGELASLAARFDELLDSLEERRTELQRAARDLEMNVAERTRELTQANHTLQQAQKRLLASEKLATIGQLTAGVAHEINNPIAVMQGNLDLVRQLLGEQAACCTAELNLLDEQVERMRLLVTQLLQFARPTDFVAYVQELDVNQAMDECLLLVQHLLVSAPIDVVRDYTATRRVSFNRHELQRLLLNLVTNAVQMMPGGGRLVLRTYDGSQHLERPTVIVEVADSGPGFSEDIRAQLFTPLFTTRQGGNGLGLPLSLALVERYGGTIEPDNAPGGGAIFRVQLLCDATGAFVDA